MTAVWAYRCFGRFGADGLTGGASPARIRLIIIGHDQCVHFPPTQRIQCGRRARDRRGTVVTDDAITWIFAGVLALAVILVVRFV